MNIYNYTQPKIGEETIQTLFKQNNVTIKHIASHALESGVSYDQDEDEWLVLIRGEALLSFEDQDVNLKQGDTFFIKRHQRHYVKKTSADALWLTVHISY